MGYFGWVVTALLTAAGSLAFLAGWLAGRLGLEQRAAVAYRGRHRSPALSARRSRSSAS